MDIDISGISVFIAIPVNRPFPHRTVQSLLDTMYLGGIKQMDMEFGMNIGLVDAARNFTLDDFLKSDKDRIFWIDNDIAWSVADFYKLVALSTVHDVVSATYPDRKGTGQYFIDIDQGETKTDDFGLIPHGGCGLGFTICSRTSMEKIAEMSPVGRNDLCGRPEYRRVFTTASVAEDGHDQGEDFDFFRKLKIAGFQPMLDPSIELGHIGEYEWRGKFMDKLKRIT